MDKKELALQVIGLLKKDELVTTDELGCLRLTEEGEKRAKQIYERYTVLTELFIRLGVAEIIAADDACRIEHYISDTTFSAIKEHLNKYGG